MHLIDRGVQARRIAALKNAIEEGMNSRESVISNRLYDEITGVLQGIKADDDVMVIRIQW